MWHRFIKDSLHRRLAAGAFWSVVGAAGARGATLLANLLTGRVLGPDQFGALGVIVSTTVLFGTFAGLGLGLTATKFVAEDRDHDVVRAGRFVITSLASSVAAALVVAAGLFAGSSWLSTHVFHRDALAIPLQISAALMFFATLNGAQSGILAGLETFKRLAVLQLFRGLLGAVGLIAGARYGGLNGCIAGQAAAELVSALIFQASVHQECRKRRIPLVIKRGGIEWAADLRAIGAFSIPALLSSLATTPALWASRVWLVQIPQGFTEAGHFEAANKWALLLLFLPTSIASVQVPMLSNLLRTGDVTGFRRVARANVLISVASCAIPGVAIALLSRPLMQAYGNDFVSGWPILAMLALGTVGVALNTSLGQMLVSAGYIWHRFAFDVGLAVLLAGSAYVLIGKWGGLGLATASAFAYAATSIALALHIGLKGREATQFWNRSAALGR